MDGVYTADRGLGSNAGKLDVISLDGMRELATLGAQVLNNRSVELAKKYGVTLEVLSSMNPQPGTIVKEAYDMNEGMMIKGVAKDTKVAVLTVTDLPDVPGISFKIFSLIGQKKINVDIILQSSGRDGNKDIIFTVPEDVAVTSRLILEENLANIGGSSVSVSCDFAKVSVVGAGMQSHSGVAAKMFEALFDVNVNVHMISTSEIKIAVIIDRAEADRAVVAIHEAFMEQA